MSNTLAVAITNRCPLKCSFCCVPPGPGDINELLAERVVRDAIKLNLFENIGFTGGEPLLRYNLIRRLGDILQEHNVRWGITTAVGSIKTQDSAHAVANGLISSGISNITVSVDETHLKNRNPEIIETFIVALAKASVPVDASVTRYSNEQNNPLPLKLLNQVSALKNNKRENSDFLRHIKISYHYVSKAGNAERSNNCSSSKFNLVKSRCPLENNISLSIWPSGDVYPCCSPYVVNKAKNLILGNIYKESLVTIVTKLSNDVFHKTIRRHGFAGLIANTPQLNEWGDIFQNEIHDPCHLCSKVAMVPTMLGKIRRVFNEKNHQL